MEGKCEHNSDRSRVQTNRNGVEDVVTFAENGRFTGVTRMFGSAECMSIRLEHQEYHCQVYNGSAYESESEVREASFKSQPAGTERDLRLDGRAKTKLKLSAHCFERPSREAPLVRRLKTDGSSLRVIPRRPPDGGGSRFLQRHQDGKYSLSVP